MTMTSRIANKQERSRLRWQVCNDKKAATISVNKFRRTNILTDKTDISNIDFQTHLDSMHHPLRQSMQLFFQHDCKFCNLGIAITAPPHHNDLLPSSESSSTTANAQ
jgi:hypothetical protein